MLAALRAVLLALAVAVVACGPFTAPTPTFTDPSKPVSVHKGETFELRLESNPTTGYKWFIATPPDPAVVTGGDRRYDGPDGPGVGAGGHEVFTYRAVATGRTEIVMFYSRSESVRTEPQAMTRTWTITVS